MEGKNKFCILLDVIFLGLSTISNYLKNWFLSRPVQFIRQLIYTFSTSEKFRKKIVRDFVACDKRRKEGRKGVF